MRNRWITFAAAALLALLAFSLDAQITQQALTQPTPQARQQLMKALQEYRDKKDGHGEALTLLQLGMVEAGLGSVSAARSDLAEGVEKMRAQNDPVGAWMGLTFLTQLEAQSGRPAEAIPHVERALAVLKEAKESNAPFTLKTFAAFGSLSGAPPQMMQMLEDPNAGALKSLMIQYSFEPLTHDLYGSVLTQAGRLEKAEAELETAKAGTAFAQGMYDYSIESHFGELRFRQQRYDEARTHYVKALNASSKTPMLPMGGLQVKAVIYDRLIRIETITGHPDEAKRWSEKARELVKKPTDGHE